MGYDVITSGYVSMDRVIKILTPPRVGFTSIVTNKDNANITYGGCSTNIAYILAQMGRRSLPAIRLGANDLEELGFRRFLKEGGVCMDAVEIVPDEATSNCYLLLDQDRSHVTIFYPGAMDGKYARPLNPAFFQQSRYAILTVGAYEDNVQFLNACRAAGTPLMFGMKSDFNAFPVPLLEEILLYSEILFMNEAECGEIKRLYQLGEITDLFRRGNARMIVTTLGKRGCRYHQKTQRGILTGQISAAEGERVADTTGSGDAFISGFAHALLEGEDIVTCCMCGSVMASFIIEERGCITNVPDRDAFHRRLAQFAKEESKRQGGGTR
ncbi:MAG: PfkB family carbohydrate kinase [Clostridiales bacterium]|nr:PfkB family carbohydrate kinase [Clostridiales bacterium]